MKFATFTQGPFEFRSMTTDGHIAYTIEDRGHTSPCFVWQRCKANGSEKLGGRGYGLYMHEGRLRPAHRVAYEAARGPVAAGLVLDHLCRVRDCVNADHLEAVTQQVNVQRARTAKLTVAAVERIHALRESGATQRAIASELGVSQALVSMVLSGQRWGAPGGRTLTAGAGNAGLSPSSPASTPSVST